jgi:glucans biosynthesis protein C
MYKPATAGHQPVTDQRSVVTTASSRRSDLDWLRVLAVLLLVPFHSALIFILDPELVAYVKDTAQSTLLIQLKDFLDRWQLELLFVIAGSASWFALSRRSAGYYVVERFRRLLVPFMVGLLTLVPLMINVDWLGRPDAPSLGEIYARFFTVGDLTGMDGRFTPSHLWFILYLLLFSLVALPVFLVLRRSLSQRALAGLARWPGSVYLLVVPLALARSVDLLGLGAKDPVYYLLIFMAGYILISQPAFQEAIDRYLWLSLALALVATLGPKILPLSVLLNDSTASVVSRLLYSLSQWTWVLTLLAAGHRWLNRDSRLLRQLSEVAYPFYIIHLPVNMLIAYYVVRLNVSVAVKYTLIVVVTTLLSLAICDLVIKRVDLLRFCFGMKPLASAAHGAGAKAVPAH